MAKLTQNIKKFIEEQVKGSNISYAELAEAVAQRYGVRVSKATLSAQAKALNVRVRRGRKRLIGPEKAPAHSVCLDGAGAFFLKGAELETGLLAAINRVLAPRDDSRSAESALQLARQINALLLYAPVFGLNTAQDIADYQGQGLLYLSGQNSLPSEGQISQYLRYLKEQKLLLPIIKEVTTILPEALLMHIDFAGQTFYLDAQGRTVWPNHKIPRYFATTVYKANGYVKSIFQSPSPEHPLILQAAPGYTFLPQEVFNLIHCFEHADQQAISRLVIMGKFGENLVIREGLKPKGRCLFIFPLNPWQYERLRGTKIIQDFRQYQLGPDKEPMAVAEARINLFNSQLNENIRLRAILVRRKEERLALVTNISPRQQRYGRRIAEQYFSRWPESKIKTYYDLMEEAHAQMLVRSQSQVATTSLLVMGYKQEPPEVFKLFLEHLHRYALAHFFPAEYEANPLKSMRERFYAQGGYLKTNQDCRQITLRPFAQKVLQKQARIACRRFNQSGIELPTKQALRIFC